jgi:hypothetical protein
VVQFLKERIVREGLRKEELQFQYQRDLYEQAVNSQYLNLQVESMSERQQKQFLFENSVLKERSRVLQELEANEENKASNDRNLKMAQQASQSFGELLDLESDLRNSEKNAGDYYRQQEDSKEDPFYYLQRQQQQKEIVKFQLEKLKKSKQGVK